MLKTVLASESSARKKPDRTMEGAMETGQLSSAMPKQFVLCFDGTGNKFAGDESDSNVLKIFRVSLLSHS